MASTGGAVEGALLVVDEGGVAHQQRQHQASLSGRELLHQPRTQGEAQLRKRRPGGGALHDRQLVRFAKVKARIDAAGEAQRGVVKGARRERRQQGPRRAEHAHPIPWARRRHVLGEMNGDAQDPRLGRAVRQHPAHRQRKDGAARAVPDIIDNALEHCRPGREPGAPLVAPLALHRRAEHGQREGRDDHPGCAGGSGPGDERGGDEQQGPEGERPQGPGPREPGQRAESSGEEQRHRRRGGLHPAGAVASAFEPPAGEAPVALAGGAAVGARASRK